MAAKTDPELLSLIFDYMSKLDKTLAQVFQKKTKAAPLPKGEPSLVEVFQHFQRTSQKKINLKSPVKMDDNSSDTTSESEDGVFVPSFKNQLLNGNVGSKVSPQKKVQEMKTIPSKKQSSSSSSDDSSEEEVSPSKQKPNVISAQNKQAATIQKLKQTPVPGKSPAVQTKPQVQGKSSSSDDSSSEEETKINTAQAKGKTTPQKSVISQKKSSSSSDDSSEEEVNIKTSTNPARVPVKTAMPIKPVPPKKDSSSEDSSSSEDETPPPKKPVTVPSKNIQQKPNTPQTKLGARKTQESSSEEDSSSEDNTVKAPVQLKAAVKTPVKTSAQKTKPSTAPVENDDSSSSEDEEPAASLSVPSKQNAALQKKKQESSSSEDSSEEDEQPKIVAKAPNKKAESSSEDSSSEDDENEVEPVQKSSKKRKQSDVEDGPPVKKNFDNYSNFSKGGYLKNEKPQQKQETFRRIREEEIEIDPRLSNNSFEAKMGSRGSWGERANSSLKNKRGKAFKHEKTKKKRGSYRGGQISTHVNSIKFE